MRHANKSKPTRDADGSISGMTGSEDVDKPLILRILPDVAGFAVSLALAYFLKWQTRDLVWSFWLFSLVQGYLTYVTMFFAVIYSLINAEKANTSGLFLFSLFGPFIVLVQTALYTMFHWVQGYVLSDFFPLPGSAARMTILPDPELMWPFLLENLIKPYGLFLIPSLVKGQKKIFHPLYVAIRKVRSGARISDLEREEIVARGVILPYANVALTHVMILLLALCFALKIESFLIYTAVYSLYFFPWKTIWGAVSSLRGKPEIVP